MHSASHSSYEDCICMQTDAFRQSIAYKRNLVFDSSDTYFGIMSKLWLKIKDHPLPAILIMGLLFRLIYLIHYINLPDWDQLLVDSLFHFRWASSIADGNILGHEPYFRAPFYIYLLGGIFSIFGKSILVGRIFGHLIGLAVVALTYSTAKDIFSKKVAVIAALVYSLNPIALYFESELLVDSLFAALILLSINFFFKQFEDSRIRWPILTGIALGLAAITRPLILPMIPLYIIWLAVFKWSSGYSIKNLGVMIIFIVLIITPVTLRNYIIGNDFVLIASSGGINFYIGNNEKADGLSAVMPPPLGADWTMEDIEYLAEKSIGRNLSASEISDYWLGQGWQWIKNNTGDFYELYIKKLYYLLNAREISNNRNIDLFFGKFPYFRYNPIKTGIIYPLALIGIAGLILSGRASKKRLFLILFILLYALTISFFFINARFRLPILPIAAILASSGIYFIIDIIKSRTSISTLIVTGAIAMAAFLIANSNLYSYQNENVAGGYFNRGNFYLYHGSYEQALENYRQALKYNPSYPDARLNIGAAYLKMGEIDSADYYFRKELEYFPNNAESHINLASLYYLEEKYDSALIASQKAIEIKPYDNQARLIQLRAVAAQDDTTLFRSALQQAELMTDSIPAVYLEAGLQYSRWKIYDKAEFYLKRALQSESEPIETDSRTFTYDISRNPREIRAMAAYQLGYIYGLAGQMEKSIELSNTAINYDSALVNAYINLASGYISIGSIQKAREILLIADRKFPENETVQRFLNHIE